MFDTTNCTKQACSCHFLQASPGLFPSDTPRGHGSLYDDGTVGGEDVKDAPFMDAVVKVFCVHTEPNFSLPWQRKRQFSSNSSGFIIKDRRVLTNAHSVEHHTQVKVKKRGSDTKYLATVLAIGTECDIGMLLSVTGDVCDGLPVPWNV